MNWYVVTHGKEQYVRENRLKKDGSDKNKENQAQREAERNPELKRRMSANQGGSQPQGRAGIAKNQKRK